jgi:hypothetical protein
MFSYSVMPDDDTTQSSPAHVRRPRANWGFWLLLAACLAMPGCGGCGGCGGAVTEDELAEEQAEEEAEKEKAAQKQKPKPDFEEARLYIQPNMPAEDRVLPVKPGHWTMATSQMKANNFHYNGELHIVAADGAGNRATIESTPYEMATIRSAPLAKGQEKFLEFAAFVPRDVQRLRLITELRGERGGVTAVYSDQLMQMPPHRYYFLVLSAQPDSFRTLSRSDTRFDAIRAPGDELSLIHYKVVAPQVKSRVPLPSGALAWSSIAYILWDDVDPALFDPDQRQALLDWLHWGGQLIVSGPGTLDKLKGSFLDASPETSYLPASAGETIKLTPEQVGAIGEQWKISSKKAPKGSPLVVARPWSVVNLKKHPQARYVEGTQHQVVERHVGRGRIAVTSFRIGQTSLLNWPSFDCFLNAVLLRRPAREFVLTDSLSEVAMRWVNKDGSLSSDITDARLTSQVRYFSRDIGNDGKYAVEGRTSDVVTTPAMNYGGATVALDLPAASPENDFGQDNTKGSGVGGWNDFRGAAAAARTSLREAAGIKIPNATFVVFVLAVYLAVLVPLNWGIFRVVGRIELAWIAAPLIAIGGALSVIKLAQLDIGFARSQTEIAVLEAYADYPRAHLTRYTALYASLGTAYDVVFEDKNAVALPFPPDADYQWLPGKSAHRVEYRRDETGARLSGFTVDSNSTGMIHSEQMFDLGGALQYSEKDGRYEVFNHTKYAIHSAGVIRRASESRVLVAWLGDLQPGMGAKASFTDAPAQRPLLAQWDFSAKNVPAVDRPLARLFSLAQEAHELEIGEVRALGIIREPLGGLTVEPEASQSERSPTLLVAHLKQTRLDNHPPQCDNNSRASLVDEEAEPFDEPAEMEDE